ncbi:hypothetical protein ACU5P1_03465 [Pseudomonas plecoglossicida]|nr:hypothetical protein [Pseudomonas plecoglossicida]QLB53938.1 hypothetical protein HAV28_03440 [Pseudomonas plecoglossicida]
MGSPSRVYLSGLQASFDFAGSPDNRKPSDLDGRGVDTRVCISPKRTHPLPRIGDRYGLLTIIDCEYGERGAVRRALVQCGCGSEPYWTTYRVLVRVGRPDVVQGCMECKYKKLREKSLAKSVRYAVGDRVGEFTVLAIERRFSGKRACNEYLLQCSCGSKPLHKTHKDLDRNKYQCCQRCWSALAVKDRKPWSPTRYKRYDEGVIPNVGDVIGLSTVLEVTFGTWGGFEEMLVQCKCGSAPRKVYNIRKFRECKTKACKHCAKSRILARRLEERGLLHHFAGEKIDHYYRFRRMFNNITDRTGNPKSNNYQYYGQRGIQMDPAWRADPFLFVAYLVTLPGWDNPDLQLDREDNNGHYEPGNVRFVTRSVNMTNRRRCSALQEELNELRARLRSLESRTEEIDPPS